MKLKELQLIILIVLPIYTKTEQSKVANTQISSESYATGKNIPETKKVIQPRWLMSTDLAFVWKGETAIKFSIKYFSIWMEFDKIDKDVQRNFFVLFLFLLKWKKPIRFIYIKQLKIWNASTYWQKMYHSCVSGKGMSLPLARLWNRQRAKLPKPPFLFKHLDEMLNIQQCQKHFYNGCCCLSTSKSVFINLEGFMERRELNFSFENMGKCTNELCWWDHISHTEIYRHLWEIIL